MADFGRDITNESISWWTSKSRIIEILMLKGFVPLKSAPDL